MFTFPYVSQLFCSSVDVSSVRQSKSLNKTNIEIQQVFFLLNEYYAA